MAKEDPQESKQGFIELKKLLFDLEKKILETKKQIVLEDKKSADYLEKMAKLDAIRSKNRDEYQRIKKEIEKIEGIFDLVKELKKQLISIQITATAKTEVEHFDVAPEIKWKSHKDLYSALVIASYEARQIKQERVRANKMPDVIGGSVDEFA